MKIPPFIFNDNYALKNINNEFREYVPHYHHRFVPREYAAESNQPAPRKRRNRQSRNIPSIRNLADVMRVYKKAELTGTVGVFDCYKVSATRNYYVCPNCTTALLTAPSNGCTCGYEKT